MKVSVYYEEVSNYVEKHYLVRPSIKQVDDKTLSIKYTPHKFIPAISVAVRIEAMRKDVICMSYECISTDFWCYCPYQEADSPRH